MVRRVTNSLEFEFELIAGGRRWRALQMASISTAKILVRHIKDEDDQYIQAVSHQCSGEDLSPLEWAAAVQKVWDMKAYSRMLGTERSKAVARVFGRSGKWVMDKLDLADTAPAVQSAVLSGSLSENAARELGRLPQEDQQRILKKAEGANLKSSNIQRIARQTHEQRQNNTARRDPPKQPDSDRRIISEFAVKTCLASEDVLKRVPARRFKDAFHGRPREKSDATRALSDAIEILQTIKASLEKV